MKMFRHTVNGRVYSSLDCSPRPETLSEYKTAIRAAYGSLRGVKVEEFK